MQKSMHFFQCNDFFLAFKNAVASTQKQAEQNKETTPSCPEENLLSVACKVQNNTKRIRRQERCEWLRAVMYSCTLAAESLFTHSTGFLCSRRQRWIPPSPRPSPPPNSRPAAGDAFVHFPPLCEPLPRCSVFKCAYWWPQIKKILMKV